MSDRAHRLLEQRLTEAMFELYSDVGHATGYWANYFLRDLKKLGGLALARKLLAAPTTSEGFERLKKERMLSRSLEALVVSAEFRPLFSQREIDVARRRLDENGYAGDELTHADQEMPRPSALTQLLEAVDAATNQNARWDLRDRVVEFGPAAREAMRQWLADEHLPPFSLSVLEKLAASDPAAARMIDSYAAFGGREAALARAALQRLRRSPESRGR